MVPTFNQQFKAELKSVHVTGSPVDATPVWWRLSHRESQRRVQRRNAPPRPDDVRPGFRSLRRGRNFRSAKTSTTWGEPTSCALDKLPVERRIVCGCHLTPLPSMTLGSPVPSPSYIPPPTDLLQMSILPRANCAVACCIHNFSSGETEVNRMRVWLAAPVTAPITLA